MILRIEGLQNVCNKIVAAVEAGGSLELKTAGTILFLSVTNREQYVSVKLDLDEEINFHATIDAALFLKLIAQTTTDTVELTLENNCLVVQANGTYKLPLICDKDGKVLDLPVITVENITSEFDTTGEILNSILTYNSNEIMNGAIYPVQNFYYLDNQGCITFTSGACINNFTLDTTAKILLNARTVKLFKLFKNETVHISIGHTPISDEILQTRVKFETEQIIITTLLLTDDKLLNSVPAQIIRDRANYLYNYSATIDKNDLLQGLKRLLLLDTYKQQKKGTKRKAHIIVEFIEDSLTIYDIEKVNYEKIYYQKDIKGCNYTAEILLDDLKLALERCKEDYIILNFGDDSTTAKGMTIIHGNIINVLQEQATLF